MGKSDRGSRKENSPNVQFPSPPEPEPSISSEQDAQWLWETLEDTEMFVWNKDNSETFLESLLNSCREWYNERDKLLRSPLTSCHGGLDGTGGTFRRWTAYIFFLTELFLRFKSRHRNVIMAMSTQGGTPNSSPTPTPAVEDRSLSLMMLIYECCEIILKPPSLNCVAEIECLRSVLTSVGRQLQLDSPQRMRQLVSLMRDAFINPSISSQIRKTLLELVELHASQWQLDLPQSMYYFPYTSMERK